MDAIRSDKSHIYTEEINKVALSAEDIKRVNIDSRNVIASIRASSCVRCSVKQRGISQSPKHCDDVGSLK